MGNTGCCRITSSNSVGTTACSSLWWWTHGGTCRVWDVRKSSPWVQGPDCCSWRTHSVSCGCWSSGTRQCPWTSCATVHAPGWWSHLCFWTPPPTVPNSLAYVISHTLRCSRSSAVCFRRSLRRISCYFAGVTCKTEGICTLTLLNFCTRLGRRIDTR